MLLLSSTAITIALAFWMDSMNFQTGLIFILSVIIWVQIVILTILVDNMGTTIREVFHQRDKIEALEETFFDVLKAFNKTESK